MALSHPGINHNNSGGDINEAHRSTSKRSGRQPNRTVDFQQHSMCWQLLSSEPSRSSRKGKSISVTAKMLHCIEGSMDTFGSQLWVSSQSSRHVEALLSSCFNAMFAALSTRDLLKETLPISSLFPSCLASNIYQLLERVELVGACRRTSRWSAPFHFNSRIMAGLLLLFSFASRSHPKSPLLSWTY